MNANPCANEKILIESFLPLKPLIYLAAMVLTLGALITWELSETGQLERSPRAEEIRQQEIPWPRSVL